MRQGKTALGFALAASIAWACSGAEDSVEGVAGSGGLSGSAGAELGGSGGLAGSAGTEAGGIDSGLDGAKLDAEIDQDIDAALEAEVGFDASTPPVDAGSDVAETCPVACVGSVNFPVETPATVPVNGYFKAYAECPAGSVLDESPLAKPNCWECGLTTASFNVAKQLWYCGAAEPVDAGPSPCLIRFRCIANDWCLPLSKPCP